MGAAQNRDQEERTGQQPEVGADSLRALLTHQPHSYLRKGPGRETFSFELPCRSKVIVKRYTTVRAREGLRQLAHGRLPKPPGTQECETLSELIGAGVRVPVALGTLAAGSTSLVVMEFLPAIVSLREHLTAHPERAAELFPDVLELVSRFHGAGWYHRDLYLDHLVLTGAQRGVVLIDLERARRDPFTRRRWFVKDLAALFHSLPQEVSRTWALRFLARWLDAHRVTGRSRRRRWWRAIVLKQARMAKHTPRGGTSYPETT